MKKFVLLASVAALAACSEAPAEDPAVDETVVSETAEAGMGGVVPGVYDVVDADGTASVLTLNADGSYAAARGEDSVSGSAEDADGKVCFTTAGDTPETECWTNSEIAEDGSFTSVGDSGRTVTVTPAAAAAE